jgi:hypothetical protein
MLGASKLRGFLLTAALVIAVLPVRPLIVALSARGAAARQCLLHGSDCQCAAHCDRTGRHSPEAHEAEAKPACHREPASASAAGAVAGSAAVAVAGALTSTAPAGSGNAASQPASGCGMTSCSKEAPLLLTAQGLPCLAASMTAELHRDPTLEAVRITQPFARFSLEASPPTPPPES